MYIIHTDVKIARRKRLHVVFDETGTVCWTGPTVEGALNALWEKGVQVFRIEGEAEAFDVSIVKVPE